MSILNAHSHTHKKPALAPASAQVSTWASSENRNRNRNQTAAEAALNPEVIDLMRYHIEEVLNDFGLTPMRVADGKNLPAEAVDFVLDAKPGFWTGLFLPKTVSNDSRFRNPVVDEQTADRISQLLTERLGGRVQLITDNHDNLIFVGVASDDHEQVVRQLTSSRPNPLFKSPQFQSQSQSEATQSVPVPGSPSPAPSLDAVRENTLQSVPSDYRGGGAGNSINGDEDDADLDREAEEAEDAAQERTQFRTLPLPSPQTRYFAHDDFTYFTDLFVPLDLDAEADSFYSATTAGVAAMATAAAGGLEGSGSKNEAGAGGVEVSLDNLEAYLSDTSTISSSSSTTNLQNNTSAARSPAPATDTDTRSGHRSIKLITDVLILALTELGLTAVAHGQLTVPGAANAPAIGSSAAQPTATLKLEVPRRSRSGSQSLKKGEDSSARASSVFTAVAGSDRLPVAFDRVDFYVEKRVLVYWLHQYRPNLSRPLQAPSLFLVSNPDLAQFEKANAVRWLEGWLNCPVTVFEHPYTGQIGIAVAVGRQAKHLLPIVEKRRPLPPRLSAPQTVDILRHAHSKLTDTNANANAGGTGTASKGAVAAPPLSSPTEFLVCLGTPLPSPVSVLDQNWRADGLLSSSLSDALSPASSSSSPLIINVHDKHVLIIGSTGMGKSSQAGLLLYQLLATKSAAELELWIADIDGSTAAQFEGYTARSRSRSRCGRTSEQILGLLGQAVGEMERRREVGDLNATFPKIVLAIEEGLMMKQHLTAAQYKEYLRLLKLLALGARKWGIWVWLLSQVLYSDADFREIKGQFLVRLAGAFEPSAAGSMGFERAAVKQLYSQKLPGQFLAHTQEYNGLLLCPALDLKGGELKRLLAALSLARHGSDAGSSHRTATAANAEANNQKPATTTTTAKAPNTPGGADTRERASFDVPTSRSTRRSSTLHKSSSAYAKYAKGGNGKGLNGNSQNTFRFGTRLTDTNSDTSGDTTTQLGKPSFDFETVSSAGAASPLDDSWAATSTSGGEEGEELALVAEKTTEPFGLNLGLDFDFDFDFDFGFDQKQEQEQKGEGYAPYDMPTTNFAWSQPPTTFVTDQKRDWNQKQGQGQGQGQGQITAKLETGETDQQLADILSSNYSDLEEKILALLRYRTKEGKGLSSNRIAQLVGGNRNTVLELIRELRRQVAD
jgi:hypothetical protein